MEYKIKSTEIKPTGWVLVKGTASTYAGAQAACRCKNSPEIYADDDGTIHFSYFDRVKQTEEA